MFNFCKIKRKLQSGKSEMAEDVGNCDSQDFIKKHKFLKTKANQKFFKSKAQSIYCLHFSFITIYKITENSL